MAEDMNNNDNEQSEGMPDDLRRLLARAEQGEDGGPDSYNPDAEDEEDDDDLVPTEIHVVEILVDGIVGGLPAGEHAGQATLLARARHLALERVVGLDHRAHGGLEALLADALAALQPFGKVDDHAHEAADDLDKEDKQQKGIEHRLGSNRRVLRTCLW